MNNTSNWRVFPQFEKSFNRTETSPVMAQIESTCRRLDEFNRSGSPVIQGRARAALAGYVRLLELIRLVNDRRQQPNVAHDDK